MARPKTKTTYHVTEMVERCKNCNGAGKWKDASDRVVACVSCEGSGMALAWRKTEFEYDGPTPPVTRAEVVPLPPRRQPASVTPSQEEPSSVPEPAPDQG